jgi:HlyD family secretion protein
MRSRLPLLVLTVATALAVSAGTFTIATRSVRAASKAPALPAARPLAAAPIRADGKVVAQPGARVSLSAEISGTVRSVEVSRGQKVKRGELLVDLVKGEHVATLEERQAEAIEAQSRFRKHQDEHQRARKLAASGSAPSQVVDDTAHDQNAALARAAAAGAASKRVSALLAKTRIVSPIDGVVVARSIEPGETVIPGARLIEIVDVDRLRVEAEVDEYYLGRVALGATARVTAEGFPGLEWAAKVDELGVAVLPRSLHPLDPRRPVDVGVLPVWIALPPGHPLRLGQRVDVTLAPASPAPGRIDQPEVR